MSRQKRIVSPINDYSCLCNKSSEFLYQPIEKVEALAIRREHFNEVMNDPVATRMRPFIAKNYKEIIQEKLHTHRDDTASKFENRIDYIDISAYGIGKVKVNEPKSNKNKEEDSESSVSEIDDAETRTMKKISGLQKLATNINVSLVCMAERQDDIHKMMFRERPQD
jgi:hypothetical protein